MWGEDNIIASSKGVAFAQGFRCHHIQSCPAYFSSLQIKIPMMVNYDRVDDDAIDDDNSSNPCFEIAVSVHS